MNRVPYSPRASRRGFVLVAVLVVIMLASMVAISLLFRLKAETAAAAATRHSEQTWAAAMSGIHQAMSVAADIPPGSLDWKNLPGKFHHQLVWEDAPDRWYFTVYCPGTDEEGSPRFGLEDESSKLNVHKATEFMLEKLPEMTPQLVQSILDFIDPWDVQRPEGAESDYYATLPRPYPSRNTALATVEELLLVRHVSPELLFGEDANLNFQLDPNEDDADARFPPDNSNGRLNRGLRQFLTVHSYDLDRDKDGRHRLSLNDPAITFFQLNLPQQLLDYIQTMRSNLVWMSHPSELLEATRTNTPPNGAESTVASGVTAEDLPLLLDQLTGATNTVLRGLVNLNSASAWVLQSLPGLDLSTAESIVAARTRLTDEQRQTTAWLVQDQLIEPEAYRLLAPHLTTRPLQFRFHVAGYGLPSGHYRIFEVIIDLATQRPSISYLRDITRLGLPFPIRDHDTQHVL